MATHSSILAWEIPWMEEPGRLLSMGLWRVRHDWATSLSLFTFRHWRRKWQPTLVLLPGKSYGWRSLVGYCPWGHKESDMTEWLHFHFVWVWELDYKESWLLKNWCFCTMVLEKTLKSPLDCKGIQPVHPKGDQFWVFTGRTDIKAETPILWPRDEKNWLIGKDSDAGRDWGQEKKGITEDEMAGWHHRLDGHESEWTLGVGDGQGGLVCCDSWGCKESDMTERLNWTEYIYVNYIF